MPKPTSKPKRDPYQVLGVGRDAAAGDIKGAHREAVKRAHPDKGGTAEEFAEVQTAFLVLSDPKKRSHYDKTGTIDDEQPAPDPDAGPIGIISHIMQAIIADEGADFSLDLAATISMALQREIETVQAALVKLETPLRRARKLMRRFRRRKAGDNRMDGIIDWHVRQIEMKIARGREAVAQCRRAQEIIAEYDFERDPAMSSYQQAYTSSSTIF